MIKLTRLGGEAFVLNADLIRYVEARPDTFITLTIGDRVVVEESMDEVLSRALEYQRSKYLIPEQKGEGRGTRSSTPRLSSSLSLRAEGRPEGGEGPRLAATPPY